MYRLKDRSRVTGHLDASLEEDGSSDLATTQNIVKMPAAPQLGQTLGNYRLIKLIGEGGMGFVFEAEHLRLGRRVALKVLRSETAASRTAVARFFREARVVNKIRHGNIVDVSDFVELDDGTAFIVMELLEGRSLRSYFCEHGPLGSNVLIEMMSQVCSALRATHNIDVVHRDLKPENIFVCDDRSSGQWVKLLDFGVAKLGEDESLMGHEQELRTSEGAVLGTPAYMAPEQGLGRAVDARSDVYAMGAIMYELLCGQRPFVGRTFAEYIHKHVAELPQTFQMRTPEIEIPRALESVVMRCLQKNPQDRFASVQDLQEALQAAKHVQAASGATSKQIWAVLAMATLLAASTVAFLLTGDNSPAQPAAAVRGAVNTKIESATLPALEIHNPFASDASDGRQASVPEDTILPTDTTSEGVADLTSPEQDKVDLADEGVQVRDAGKRRSRRGRSAASARTKVRPLGEVASETPSSVPKEAKPEDPSEASIDLSTTFNPFE